MKKKFLALASAILLLAVVLCCLFVLPGEAKAATTYTITYYLDGGTNALKNPDVYTVADNITLKDATKAVEFPQPLWYNGEENEKPWVQGGQI